MSGALSFIKIEMRKDTTYGYKYLSGRTIRPEP
jgi:hypothetical protein